MWVGSVYVEVAGLCTPYRAECAYYSWVSTLWCLQRAVCTAGIEGLSIGKPGKYTIWVENAKNLLAKRGGKH